MPMILTQAEAYTAAEFHAMALGELAFALAEVGAALIGCGTDAIEARRKIAFTRNSWRRQDGTYIDKSAFEIALEEARTEYDTIVWRVRSLKELKSTLQTIVRSTP